MNRNATEKPMNIIAIVPARMGSSRYPGKPLALIHGTPMVGHVAFRTAMATFAGGNLCGHLR